MKMKIALSMIVVALLNLSAAEFEKVYKEDGTLSIPSYPILDKRALSTSRGGDQLDSDAAIDGMGVLISAQEGKTVNPSYGKYNTLLQNNQGINSLDALLAEGVISADELQHSNDVCLNETFSCLEGMSINNVTNQCEAAVTCSDPDMTFNGNDCSKILITSEPAILGPNTKLLTRSESFVVPYGVTNINVCLGGAGGGGAGNTSRAYGGSAGEKKYFSLNVSPNQTFDFISGQGGKGGEIKQIGADYKGFPGGDSTFAGITARGGAGGQYRVNATDSDSCPGHSFSAGNNNNDATGGGAGPLGNGGNIHAGYGEITAGGAGTKYSNYNNGIGGSGGNGAVEITWDGYSCPGSATLNSSLNCITETPVTSPASCLIGVYDSSYGKCISDIIRTCH